jgi:hypothetical protein
MRGIDPVTDKRASLSERCASGQDARCYGRLLKLTSPHPRDVLQYLADIG